ncbi:4-hydroxythreonine-4-phosphate dehydrogenase PdxA [Candidatus Purcelliella pentastirinorum]|uniref:4-hydroxythreonine-4-phosphate dehydrogenase PdxA n=1 Tax=Candidatus Purcelliella pentastirinorum TaxID=472834 RepID=UPI0023689EE4|nr:4-hydroxythreonine-4-phosphate dehydrogenase PdxA [Candidatus Purcelliella pentastirinorum]WDI79035.1 4-hydroxythreonine-4-phosphate dehydrogenase PdxA [Candidatus Purcelliella pentastirinorum]
MNKYNINLNIILIMYHGQKFIVLKFCIFNKTINIYFILLFIRTFVLYLTLLDLLVIDKIDLISFVY